MIQKLVGLYLKATGMVDKRAWLAPLLLRLTVGVAFMITGWAKLTDIQTVVDYFTRLEIPAPEIQARFIAGLEFFGGLALVLGFATRFFAVPLMVTMAVAIRTAKWAKIEEWRDLFDPFSGAGVEFNYLAFFLLIALVGAGPVSLDYFIGKKLIPSAVPPADPRTPTSTSSSPQP